jgi:RNA polymerase sigma factor for flagellar operon FliA
MVSALEHLKRQKNFDRPVTNEDFKFSKNDTSRRNFIVVKYLPLVRTIAADVCASTSANVEYDDLVSVGVFGLMDSVRSFDCGRKVRFSTYCKRRIRGAMLDELRQLDWVPRWARQRSNLLRKTENFLESKLNRKPTNSELAEEMGLDGEQFKKVQNDSSPATMVSLDTITTDTDLERSDSFEDGSSPDPVNKLQKKDAREFIVKSLSKIEKMVITLYYYEQMTMRQIGNVLDISESRVSQIHSELLDRLRGRASKNKEKFLAAV